MTGPCLAVVVKYVCPTDASGTAKDPVMVLMTSKGIAARYATIFYGQKEALVIVDTTTLKALDVISEKDITEITDEKVVESFPDLFKAGYKAPTALTTPEVIK